MVEKECGDLIELFRFCRCVSCKVQPSFYAYYFSVILPENISNEDESYKELVQKVAEKNVAEHMRCTEIPAVGMLRIWCSLDYSRIIWKYTQPEMKLGYK